MVCSILFRDPARAGDIDQAPPACFRDLNLDQLVAAITRRRDEYDLAPFFHTRLTDVDAIAYRHEVLHDLENQALVDALESFASAMQRVRRRLRLATKLRYQYERHSWLLHARGWPEPSHALLDTVASAVALIPWRGGVWRPAGSAGDGCDVAR